jgi:hypothetical protein
MVTLINKRRTKMKKTWDNGEYAFHGDVHIIACDAIPEGAKESEEKVLEYGEVTGHAHRYHEPTTQLFKTPDGRKFLRVIKPTDLSHEEHATRVIPPGDFEIRRTKETDHMSGVTRMVAD